MKPPWKVLPLLEYLLSPEKHGPALVRLLQTVQHPQQVEEEASQSPEEKPLRPRLVAYYGQYLKIALWQQKRKVQRGENCVFLDSLVLRPLLLPTSSVQPPASEYHSAGARHLELAG